MKKWTPPRAGLSLAAAGAITVLLGGCGGGGGDTPAAVDTSANAVLTCDDSMKSAFKPDANTTVLLVKALKAGDPIPLAPPAPPAPAPGDMCVVKLLVGPGHAGPVSAPSTTPGIGIEVWLPAKTAWNKRVHILGGAGLAGGVHTSLTAFAAGSGVNPWDVAGTEGAVSATTDTGHPNGTPTFLMNPDGTANTVGWDEFAQRGIHEMTLKAKALAQAYYGGVPKYTYWQGGSTGGRQGLKQAQLYPDDFDGIIATSPAINWSRVTTSILYGQVGTQRDLIDKGVAAMTAAQTTAVSMAALSACDVVGGQHLGFLLDPGQCRYDPTKDTTVLCPASGGTNADANTCVNTAQANALNKVWYGQTRDGSVPAPAADTGPGPVLTGQQVWYGFSRGAELGVPVLPVPGLGTITGPVLPHTTLGTDLVALYLQDPTIGSAAFTNATGNGADGWKALTYAQLAHASDRAVASQAAFGSIDTDNADLSRFKARGGKLITFHGTSDNIIPHGGTVQYYTRVASAMGGLGNVQSFYKLYLVPGMGHFPLNGTVNPAANPPIPGEPLKYQMLTDWVEKGTEPGRVDVSNAAKGMAMCVYPQSPAYVSGNIFSAGSYACR
ncbi:MAG: tannase/feruloyl esterase family alpha/beta hydrolase [Pseudomonadota bacterium]